MVIFNSYVKLPEGIIYRWAIYTIAMLVITRGYTKQLGNGNDE